MNRNKATHQGSCQICGSLQKLPHGVLSLHGYTKQWGFFNGTCPGSGSLPFEMSCNLIGAAIVKAQAQIEHMDHIRQTLTDEKPTEPVALIEMNHVRMGTTWQRRTVELTETTNGYKMVRYVLEPGDKNNGFIVNRIDWNYAEAVKRGFEQSDVLAWTWMANQRYARHLEYQAAKMAQYVEWQQARIKNWVAAPDKRRPVKG